MKRIFLVEKNSPEHDILYDSVSYASSPIPSSSYTMLAYKDAPSMKIKRVKRGSPWLTSRGGYIEQPRGQGETALSRISHPEMSPARF